MKTTTMKTTTIATIRPASTTADWLEATALLHDYVEWIRAAAGIDPLAEQPGLAAELLALADHYNSSGSTLFVARLGDLTAGTVAIRYHIDGAAELKRMYLRPVARGRGIADRLMARTLDAATERGCRTVWLESLRGVMEPALAVYRRHGFVELESHGRTVNIDGMVVMERLLAPPQPGPRARTAS